MIVLAFPEYNAKVAEWEDKLRELVVAHRLEEHPSLSVPCLRYGANKYSGDEAIDAFLPDLARELAEWRNDSCGG